MRGPVWLAAWLLLLAGGSYAFLESGVAVASPSSSHPSSVLPFGTSLFYSDLQRYWQASQGGVIEGIGADAYLVIAPDKPFTPEEVGALRERLTRGGFGLLLADETRVGASLARELFGIAFYDGYVFNARVPPGNPAIETVVAECMGELIVTTRSSMILDYPGWMEPVCWLVDVYAPLTGEGRVERGVLAVYGEVNGSRVLVVADSTLFTNLLYRGAFGTPPTRQAALQLVELVAPRGSRVVYDTDHLAKARIEPVIEAVVLAIEAPASAVKEAMSSAHGPLAAFAAVAGAVGGTLILLGPPATPKARRGRRASRGELMYLARECSALGVGQACPPWLVAGEAGDVEASDLEWVAGRILRALSRGGGEWQRAGSRQSSRRSRRY